MTQLYWEFHFPLAIKELIQNLLGAKNFDPTNPQAPATTAVREWFSQPRPSTDTTTEVVTVNFKLPLSVSEFSAEFTRTSMRAEVWYKDRSNNWMQMRDRQRVPLALNLSGSSTSAWYKYTSSVYPIVAKAIQIRLTRTPDPELFARPYSVGIRNALIKRNVYDRHQGVQYFEEEQDPLGNVISKYIKDWDAAKAIDGNATTYWKSAPMPDPEAVVSLYLDVRTDGGAPQAIDQLYVDPVYSGQHLNVYYSNDDTVANRKLSPIQILPDTDANTDWRAGRGRWDVSPVTGLTSNYAFTGHWGPQQQQAAWIGIEWSPDFAPLDGPAQPQTLFKVTPDETTTAWAPEITYSPASGNFSLTFRSGVETPITYTAPTSLAFVKDEPVRIVVGWAYNPKRIIVKAVNRAGSVIAQTSATTSTLPDTVSFDGSLSFQNFRGLLTATVVKIEDWTAGADAFFSNPTTYVSPEPVLPDPQGNIPPSSLDNAIYAVDWSVQQHGVGGTDQSEFGSKEWTPIWRDYVAEKGTLYFPQMISAKYLKLEFTNLSEEPYPIYESGIDVAYKVYPVSVKQVATLGFRLITGLEVGGLFGVANINGVKSINWLDARSVAGAINGVFGPTYDPVQIDVGPGTVTRTLPNRSDSPITKSYQPELSSRRVYRREVLDPYVLAQDQYYTTIKAEGLMKIQPYVNIPWEEIYAANPGSIATNRQIGALPVRGSDAWIFPGQTLRIPAAVMERLTSSSTVTERRATLERRVRFTTSAVHRYDVRTVRRDAAIAYFAGVREVIPMVASYVYGQDKDTYDFPFYTDEQWQFTNIRTADNGAVTWNNVGEDGRLFFNLQTFSKFAKLRAEFRDSGLLRAEALWASDNSDKLSPYAKMIPPTFDGSTWLDSFVDWTDESIAWGAPRGVVAVNLDGDRRYQGRRVLRFSRAPGAGEAGISLDQTTHFVPGSLFRLGTVLYKPFENDNIVLIRLVRKADNAVIYEYPVETPVGRWVDFTTDFVEVPDVTDQNYRIELVMTGDDEDELYVSDLYSELSHVRYFIRLGDSGQYLHEVTDLRYAKGAQVVASSAVNEASVEAVLLSDEAFAFGVTLVPSYLQ